MRKLQRKNSTTPQVRLVNLQAYRAAFCLNCFFVSEPTDDVGHPPEELCELLTLNAANQVAKSCNEEPEKDKTEEQQTTTTPSVSYPTSRFKIHSRKFRE